MRVRDYAIVAVIALASTIPFLNKAFHIDDVLYLRIADQIVRTPLDPYGYREQTPILWDSLDGTPATLFETDFNPPLWKYALAGMTLLVGHVEWKLHLLPMLVVLLGAWGIYRVSRRITRRPLWCTVMVILAPFFWPGQNLMLEVPSLCLVAWGLDFFVRGWETRRVSLTLAAGTLVGLAVLTKYTYVLLVPILIFAIVQKQRWRSLWFIVPAGLLVGAWCLHNAIMYGEWHLTSHGATFKPEEWPIRILTVLRIIGSVSLFGPVLWRDLDREGKVGRMLLGSSWIIGSVLGWLDLQQTRAWHVAKDVHFPEQLAPFFFVFTMLGTATILSLFALSYLEMRRNGKEWLRSGDRTLEACVALLFVFNVASVPFNAVRHLLLAFLALTWIAARRLDRKPAPWLAVSLAVASSILGGLLAWGDYDYANAYRTVAQNQLRIDVATRPKVWFTGTWGFKYYAEQEGAVHYFPGIQRWGLGGPIAGDRVYHPQMLNWAPIMRTLPSAQAVDGILLEGSTPLRTILPATNYYGVTTQLLPWGSLLITHPNDGSIHYAPIDYVKIFDMAPAGR